MPELDGGVKGISGKFRVLIRVRLGFREWRPMWERVRECLEDIKTQREEELRVYSYTLGRARHGDSYFELLRNFTNLICLILNNLKWIMM